MLITSGDAAIGLLQSCFPNELRQPVIMVGSTFEDDQSPSYSYNTLSRIIMCSAFLCICGNPDWQHFLFY